MNNYNDYYNSDYIKHLINYLNSTHLKESPPSPLPSHIMQFEENIALRIQQSKNAPSQLYSVEKARQLVVDYINKPDCTQKLKSQHHKIVEIYQRLTQLNRGTGSWADGIDQELLHAHESPASPSLSTSIPPPDLEDLITGNVILPDSPEETLLKSEEMPSPLSTRIPDKPLESYHFSLCKGLKAPTEKMLFHIHADEFGTSSQLEGSKAPLAVDYLKSYLEKTYQSKSASSLLDTEALIRELSNFIDIPPNASSATSNKLLSQFIQSSMGKIGQALDTRTPLLLLGGWVGVPFGHAIYYEILPTSDKSATFRIYNTGAGINQYHASKPEGQKLKYQAYVEWQGVSREKLLSPYFLEALFELQTHARYNLKPTEYGTSDIYESLKLLLQPHTIREPSTAIDTSHFRSAQRSGICSWKSLMAFVRTKMDTRDYKRFKCDIKLQSLHDFVANHSPYIPVEDWRLVEKSHKNLCRSIVKLYQEGLIGDIYIQSAKEILDPIAAWIVQNADCRFKKIHKTTEFNYTRPTPTLLENKETTFIPLYTQATAPKTDTANLQPWQNTISEFNYAITQPQELEGYLAYIHNVAKKAWLAGDDLALHRGLSDVITQLPITPDFWQQAVGAERKKAELLIMHLGSIADFFLKSCFTATDPHVFSFHKIYAIEKILFLQQTLCNHWLGDSSKTIKLCNLKNLLSDITSTENLFLSFPQAKIHEDILTITSFLRLEKLLNPIHEGEPQDHNPALKISFKKNNATALGPMSLEKFIRDEYPEVVEQIYQQIPHFKNLPVHSQDAYIFTSSLLPDWIKAMRGAEIAGMYIQKCCLGTLHAIDRSADLQQQFTLTDFPEHVEVVANLQGLSQEILQQEKVKKILKKGFKQRYTSQYPDIQSKSLDQLLTWLTTSLYPLHEKGIVSTRPQDFKLTISQEDYRELMPLLIPSGNKMHAALEYFTKYPSKLKERDYQTLLQVILFNTALIENLKLPDFPKLLLKFLENNYQLFKDQNEIHTVVFILKLANQLHDFCPENPFYAHAYDYLKSLLQLEGLEQDEKLTLHAELLAQLSRRTELNTEDIVHLVASSIYIEENLPLGSVSIDAYTRKEGREALMLHAKKIQDCLMQGAPNQAVLNQIFRMLHPEASKKDLLWKVQSVPQTFPCFSSVQGDYTLYPLKSLLTMPHAIISTPSAIGSHPLFNELFPEVKQGHLIAGNLFAFKDSSGRDTVVQLKDNNTLIIEQKMLLNTQERWCRFVPSSCLTHRRVDGSLSPLIESRYLADNYHFWQTLDEENSKELHLYALDKQNRKPCYELTGTLIPPGEVEKENNNLSIAIIADLKKNHSYLTASPNDLILQREIKELHAQGKIKTVKPHADAMYFTLEEIQDVSDHSKLSVTSSTFTHLEHPSCIHEWYTKEGKLQKIELPRLGLSFRPDSKKPELLNCDQFQGYHIKQNAIVKELGSFQHYLVLENAGGIRKVILPKHTFTTSPKKEVLNPNYTVDMELHKSKLPPVLVFEISKKGLLFHKSRQANLFLAHVLAISQEYHLAADYLKNYGEKLSAYSPEELHLLDTLAHMDVITGDKSGNIIAIQLHALYLKAKNDQAHLHEISATDRSSLNKLYNLYLEHLRHATALQLNAHEESFILKHLLKDEFNTLYYMRLHELDPASTQQINLPTASSAKSAPPLLPTNLSDLYIPKVYRDGRILLNPPLLTRIHQSLYDDFMIFYELAKSGNREEKERLKSSLAFAFFAENAKHADLAYFFDVLLDNPDAFPDPLEPLVLSPLDKQKREEEWKKQVRETANKLLTQRASKQTESTKLAPDTSDAFGFHFVNAAPAQKSLQITPSLPAILPFQYQLNFSTYSERIPEEKSTDNFQKAIALSLSSENQKLLERLQAKISVKNSDEYAFTSAQHSEIIHMLSSIKRSGIPEFVKHIKKNTHFKDFNYLIPRQNLIKIIHILSSSFNVEENERLRLINDLDNVKVEPTYAIKNQYVDEVLYTLSIASLRDKKMIQDLEQDILLIANKSPISATAQAFTEVKKLGELQKVITLEEILVHFAQNDYADLMRRNPALQAGDIQLLADKTAAFLLYATHNQQRERALATIDKILALRKINKNSEDIEYKELLRDLGSEIGATRQFDPLSHPAYLVFEYYANISMRKSQVEKLEKFLQDKDKNPIMEMIMGSGKSKVLLPLLGLLRADGKTLSMLVVPQQLFESVAHDTKISLQGAFSQALHSLHFDRDTPFTSEFLETILKDLEHIKKHKECLILTNKSVQCLLLKYISECAHHFSLKETPKEFSHELKVMGRILKMLHEAGYPLIDEADTIFNVLHEVNFTGGRQLSPVVHELELISEIYSLIYEHPEIKKIARIESDPRSHKSLPLLTESLYYEKIQHPLAEAFIQRLDSISFQSESLTQKVSAFKAGLDHKHRNILLDYLCRNKEHLKQAQEYFDSLDEDLQDILALASEQISHLLPYTLTKNCDEKYGIDGSDDNPLAIPFSGANTPNRGSQFANPLITMNYTMQTYMRKGISQKLIEVQLKILQEQALREITASGGKLQLKDTLAGKAFDAIKGPLPLPLFNYKPIHLSELVTHLNADPAAIRTFVTRILFPQMQLHEHKISCNPHNLAALFQHLCGFTGTLWNSHSMHHSLHPEPQAGTEAKTLQLLWANSRENALSLKEGSTQEMLKQLEQQSISFDMICDTGGYFKEGSNKEIAHKIACTRGEATVYYDSKGEQTLTQEGEDISLSESNVSPEKRLTFLDQIHTTGADIPQKWNAVALVTIGQNILLRDLLQSVWRLRGLDKHQKVRFVVSEEVASIIRQKLRLKSTEAIGLESLLNFAISNQAAQQSTDNYKALKNEINNIAQSLLVTLLLNNKLSHKAKSQAFHYLKAYWIQPAIFRAKDLYGNLSSEDSIDNILKKEKAQGLAMIHHLFSKMPWLEQVGIAKQSYIEAVESIVDRFKGKLPETMNAHSGEISLDTTVEAEKSQESEKQAHKQTETQKETKASTSYETTKLAVISSFNKNKNNLVLYGSFKEALQAMKQSKGINENPYTLKVFLDHYPLFPLKSFIQSKRTDRCLKPLETAFEGINISLNALEWSLKTPDWLLLGPNRINFHHVLINDDDTVTLITDEEFQDHKSNPNYYNLALGFYDPDRKLSPTQLLKVVKLKFLNGESLYSLDELHLLELWFKAQGKEKMHKLFVEHILNGFPQKQLRYQNSPLKNLLEG